MTLRPKRVAVVDVGSDAGGGDFVAAVDVGSNVGSGKLCFLGASTKRADADFGRFGDARIADSGPLVSCTCFSTSPRAR